MRIAISSDNKTLEGDINPLFGRCPYFLIIEDGKLIKAVKNTAIDQRGGAGVAAAKIVAQEKVNSVVSGNIGPRALEVLEQFNIKVIIKTGLKKEVV